MKHETTQANRPFDPEEENAEPRVSVSLERIVQQAAALHDRIDRLANLLEPVLYGPMTMADSADPQPARSVPPLVAKLDDIYAQIVRATGRVDDLGDRMAL